MKHTLEYIVKRDGCNCGGEIIDSQAGDETFYVCESCGKLFGA